VLIDPKPVQLTGQHVTLVRMQSGHAPALFAVGHEPEIWRYMPHGPVDTVDAMRNVIDRLLAREAQGTDLCFVTTATGTGEVLGMTRFMDIQPANDALEIGGTFLGQAARRTAANTEAKLLMLTHAFEVWRAHRVQMKTDLRNIRSQQAIERLGLTREGVLREHLLMPDGYRRSSVYFSALREEWPAIKVRLQARLAQA
jgi:N-acetyltransferase